MESNQLVPPSASNSQPPALPITFRQHVLKHAHSFISGKDKLVGLYQVTPPLVGAPRFWTPPRIQFADKDSSNTPAFEHPISTSHDVDEPDEVKITYLDTLLEDETRQPDFFKKAAYRGLQMLEETIREETCNRSEHAMVLWDEKWHTSNKTALNKHILFTFSIERFLAVLYDCPIPTSQFPMIDFAIPTSKHMASLWKQCGINADTTVAQAHADWEEYLGDKGSDADPFGHDYLSRKLRGLFARVRSKTRAINIISNFAYAAMALRLLLKVRLLTHF